MTTGGEVESFGGEGVPVKQKKEKIQKPFVQTKQGNWRSDRNEPRGMMARVVRAQQTTKIRFRFNWNEKERKNQWSRARDTKKDAHSPRSDVRLVVPSRSQAILPCPVDADRASITYSWYRNEMPLGLSEDSRMETTDTGSLWVKDTVPEDTGLYVCRAVSEVDSVEVNITLIVLETFPDLPPTEDFFPVSVGNESQSERKVLPVSKQAPEAPIFTNQSAMADISTLNRTVGSSVRFKCPASGNPRPQVTWYKNDILLDEEELTPESKRGRWSLVLRNLRLKDNGNYTCLVSNRLGSIKATFPLEVTDGSGPDLAVFHPLNTTVKFGSSATFQCRVRSDATPNIQWLKRIEDFEEESEKDHGILKVQGENFRVLKSSEVMERSDGSFLNKLVIPEAHETDSGKYICLGANSNGYSFRSAFLTVLPRPKTLPLGWSRSVAVHPGHPSSLLVAIPITLGVLVGVLVALVVLCHRRRLDTPLPPRPSSSSRRLEFRHMSRTGCDFATTALDVEITKVDRKEASSSASVEAAEQLAAVTAAAPTSAISGEAQSEVELAGDGSVVTKLCQQQPNSTSYDSCFVLRDEV